MMIILTPRCKHIPYYCTSPTTSPDNLPELNHGEARMEHVHDELCKLSVRSPSDSILVLMLREGKSSTIEVLPGEVQ